MFQSEFWPGAWPFPVRRHHGHGLDHVPHHHPAVDELPVERAGSGWRDVPGEKVPVMAAIYAENDRRAEHTRNQLTCASVLCINVMGAPGAGKTSAILALIQNLPHWHHYVVEGDIESDLDTRTLQNLGVATLQINTHGACHLDSLQVESALENLEWNGPGLLLIENIGNLVCPAEMMIGEHLKLLILTVADGSDKPYKYPLAFEKADLILLNKADLLPYVDFDQAFFMVGVRALNPQVPVFLVSARNREGFEPVAEWLRQKADQLGICPDSRQA